MPTISWPRRSSYQAAVLLIPLDPLADAAVGWWDPALLDGITVAGAGLFASDEGFPAGPPRSPATRAPGGRPDKALNDLDTAVNDADIVVLLTHDLAAVDRRVVARAGESARRAGTLLGAVILAPELRWDGTAANASAASLREAADNVVVLSDASLATGFIEVLRGGTRPCGAALTAEG